MLYLEDYLESEYTPSRGQNENCENRNLGSSIAQRRHVFFFSLLRQLCRAVGVFKRTHMYACAPITNVNKNRIERSLNEMLSASEI